MGAGSIAQNRQNTGPVVPIWMADTQAIELHCMPLTQDEAHPYGLANMDELAKIGRSRKRLTQVGTRQKVMRLHFNQSTFGAFKRKC